jgi:hypothetical protein
MADSGESMEGHKARVLDGLYRLAEQHRSRGALRQAVGLYFEIAEEHPGTDQGVQARERLMEIADRYETGGESRQARGIYQRLL